MFGDFALRRWDPFDINWSIWRQFEMMDRLLDRSFESFDDQMENFRKQALKSNEQKQNKPERTSYTKSYHSLDQREDVVNGKRICYKTLETTKEKDGVKIPHVIREITCDPPCELDTLRDYVKLKEKIGDQEQPAFTQFLNDVKNKNLDQPDKIVKYFNEVKHNADTNKNDYLVNVSFLDKNNQKHVYQFQKGQDAIEGQSRIDEPQMLQSSEYIGQGSQTQQKQGYQEKSQQQEQKNLGEGQNIQASGVKNK